jgi:hypothetical protein
MPELVDRETAAASQIWPERTLGVIAVAIAAQLRAPMPGACLRIAYLRLGTFGLKH